LTLESTVDIRKRTSLNFWSSRRFLGKEQLIPEAEKLCTSGVVDFLNIWNKAS
jgi:hypothetical protein